MSAASIWFEKWGVVDPGEKISIFSGNLTKIIDFSRQISEKFRFFQVILQNKFDFSRQISQKFRFLGNFTKKIPFSRQQLAIYSYFWVNYSISLHHFRTYFLYMIRYIILPPVNDLHDSPLRPPPRPSLPKIWGSRPPQPPGLTPMQSASKVSVRQTVGPLKTRLSLVGLVRSFNG